MSATRKAFAQHLLNQDLQCPQTCTSFQKQSDRQPRSHCPASSRPPTHSSCPEPRGTYLENRSTRADDLFLLTRESSFAVILKDCEVHCLLLNGDDSILSPQTPAQEESSASVSGN